MASNFFTKEIPFAKVRGEVAGTCFEAKCDEEGYFLHQVEIDDIPRGLTLEYGAEVAAEGQAQANAPISKGTIYMCTGSAQRIIISDIDDTVIDTGASKLWQLLKNTLLENVHTRRIFQGVSEFYQQLQEGPTETEWNPIFYVTSSPWNLRDFILEVFDIRGISRGPLFMTDWGIDDHKLLKEGHHDHKIDAIRHLLSFHAPLPAVLIGDSGEKDPEIYAQLVRENPGRISTIYIRDVSESGRDQEVQILADACNDLGVELHLVEDTETAVVDARSRDLIS